MDKENLFFIHHRTGNTVKWKINEDYFKPSLLCKAYDYARQRLPEIYPDLFSCNNNKGPGENDLSKFIEVVKSSELLDELMTLNAA